VWLIIDKTLRKAPLATSLFNTIFLEVSTQFSPTKIAMNGIAFAFLFILNISCVFGWKSFQYSRSLVHRKGSTVKWCTEASQQSNKFSAETLTSPAIEKLLASIEDVKSSIQKTRLEIDAVNEELRKANDEYAPEVNRVRKEFARMKERSLVEAEALSNKAKAAALKEVLPILDTYSQAKKLFDPVDPGDEEAVDNAYSDVFDAFGNVVRGFGVEKVESLGRAFNAMFMEAIQAAPSTEYPKDVVCIEYQAGYRMGDSCIRPAMVVVSTGPGPGDTS